MKFHLEITEDDDHYYVAIDPEERERAKSILPREWNPERRKWVYPHTQVVRDAITKEFSDRPDAFNLSKQPSSTPTPPAPVASAVPERDSPAQTTPLIAPSETATLLQVLKMLQEQENRRVRINDRLRNMESMLAKLPQGNTPGSVEITNSIRLMLAEFEQRMIGSLVTIDEQPNANAHASAWLASIVTRGAEDDPTIIDICKRWNLVNDLLSVIADCEEKLKIRLRDMLDLGHDSKMDLNNLINEANESRSIGREQYYLLCSFRLHRNELMHNPTEYKPYRVLRYLHALTALALAWPELGKQPSPEDGGGDNYGENRP